MEGNENLTDVGDDDDEMKPLQYYKSQKILGKLYRAIDEDKFLKELGRFFGPLQRDTDFLYVLAKHIGSKIVGFDWKSFIPEAESFKAMLVTSIPFCLETIY